MAEYKSEVKKILYPQERVYAKLADLSNLAAVQQHADNPELRRRILDNSGGKATPEQIDQVLTKIKEMRFDTDTVSADSPIGTVTLRIVERDESKTIKFALEGVPMESNLWIQLLPDGETGCAMRVTLRAELNFFMKQVVGGKLQKGVDGLAQMLASIPY